MEHAEVQRWDPITYVRDASFIARLGEPLLDLLAPQPGERILDLGCGDGALTEKIGARGAQVIGVDASAEQVAAARARGIDARVADGERLSFDGEFDAVFSNATLHWMKRPERAIEGVRRALRTGGRFVAEFGGAGNIQTIRGALEQALDRRGVVGSARSPWYFPTVAAYREQLEAGGFAVEHIETFARPTVLEGDIMAWLALFSQSFTDALPHADRSDYLHEVRAAIEPTLRDASGVWRVDYTRLRFGARRF
jgi:SAM-dependent methyltransferase